MNNQQIKQSWSCPCGAATFDVHTKPLARFHCHCLICQKLYQKPSADFNVMFSNKVTLHDPNKIKFNRYRLPPALRRGVCKKCNHPVIGFLSLAPFVELAFVASSHFQDTSLLPSPQAHIFYHRRSADINDELPKHEGYLKSEWAVIAGLTKGVYSKLSKHQ